jgi:hypothetical protein
MNSLIRIVLPAAALAAGLTMLTTGCRSAGAGVAAPASSASSAPATAASSSPVAVTRTTAPPSGAAGPAPAATASTAPGPVVYLAEGGSVTGTWLHAPACASDCVLSGDSTVALWHMTWSTWNSATAVGMGTEKLNDCNPNCAQGTLHPVPVTVTLSKPVLVCVAGKSHGTWFWTRTSFAWLAPLPKAFAGGNAPLNPFDYVGLAQQAAKSCP